jgi:4-hydroxythreonine-4-phosphate dehydrogenase
MGALPGDRSLKTARPIPRVVFTPGEPAGIGLDLAVKLSQRPHAAELVIVADPHALEHRAEHLGLPLVLKPFSADAPARPQAAGTVKVAPVMAPAPVVAGRLEPRNALYVLETLRLAARGCLGGIFGALVTGPVHKAIVNRAGIPFTGHTEFLARLTAAPHPVMMLVSPGLRVALATTHLPLREVPDAITASHLEAVLRVLHRELCARFELTDPTILVLGLNPHAGEGGHLGREEAEIMEPVLGRLRREGLRLQGPAAADTAFRPERLRTVDAVLAMYHDQGLPVLKALGFGQSVNVTLGLPIVRTSVDHGTALELAGTGNADPRSLDAAVDLAIELAARSR